VCYAFFMEAVFWGTRGSLPRPLRPEEVVRKLTNLAAGEDGFATRGTYGGNTACVELRGAAAAIVCDAGSGLRDCGNALVAALEPETPLTVHLFISHPHWDHIQGFPFFAPAYREHTTIFIYGGHEELRRAFTIQQSPPFFPIAFPDLPATIRFVLMRPGTPLSVAGVTVSCYRQNHPGDSYGYRFTAADGASLVYATDSEVRMEDASETAGYIDFMRDADLLIFDAQYDFLHAESYRRDWGHASNIAAIELALDAGVRELALFHADPAMSDEDLDRVENDSREFALHVANGRTIRVRVAYDGLQLPVRR